MKSTKKLQDERNALIEKREKKKEEHKVFLQDINNKIKDKEDEIKRTFAERLIKKLQIKDFDQFATAEKEISEKIGEIDFDKDDDINTDKDTEIKTDGESNW